MLDSERVDHLFAILASRYGSGWFNKFEGVPIANVRLDWAKQTHGFTMEALEYAVDNLPAGRVPDAGEFRMLCRQAPRPQTPLLTEERPPPNVERIRAIGESLKRALLQKKPNAAEELARRRAEGEHLNFSQRSYLQRAQFPAQDYMPLSDAEMAKRKAEAARKVEQYERDHPRGYA